MSMSDFKKCAETRDFNPDTCRFVKKCKDGFERDIKTFECKPIKKGTRGLKKKSLKSSFDLMTNMLKNKSNEYLYNPLNKNSIQFNKTLQTRARSYSANRPRTARSFGRTGSFNRPVHNRKLNTSRKLGWFNFNTAKQDLIKSKKKRPTVKRGPPLKQMTPQQKEMRAKSIANRVAHRRAFQTKYPDASQVNINADNREYMRKKANEYAKYLRNKKKATNGIAI